MVIKSTRAYTVKEMSRMGDDAIKVVLEGKDNSDKIEFRCALDVQPRLGDKYEIQLVPYTVISKN